VKPVRPPLRSTYTYAILEVGSEFYREVREKLEAAGYTHAFHADTEGEVIDMHGIALRAEPEPAPAPSVLELTRDLAKAREECARLRRIVGAQGD
jgi:hypothetical protein